MRRLSCPPLRCRRGCGLPAPSCPVLTHHPAPASTALQAICRRGHPAHGGNAAVHVMAWHDMARPHAECETPWPLGCRVHGQGNACFLCCCSALFPLSNVSQTFLLLFHMSPTHLLLPLPATKQVLPNHIPYHFSIGWPSHFIILLPFAAAFGNTTACRLVRCMPARRRRTSCPGLQD